MKAVVLYEQGGVEKLVYTDYPDPEITVSELCPQSPGFEGAPGSA